MSVLHKAFKNRVSGETFTIIDQYQNVAITSNNKEKIDVNILLNDKLFTPVRLTNENFSETSKNRSFDTVDPNDFFDDQNTYNAFAKKIMEFPLDNFRDEFEQDRNNIDEDSAVIMVETEDEIEELKRKYGATHVDDSLQKQTEMFTKILDDENNQWDKPKSSQVEDTENIVDHSTYREPDVIITNNPILMMFRNVKRSIDFSLEFKISDKIPRLDFIEMMEDSYETSIIEYLADEFTRKLLNDPTLIRNQIIDKINSLIKDKTVAKVKPKVQKKKVIPTKIIKDKLLKVDLPEKNNNVVQ